MRHRGVAAGVAERAHGVRRHPWAVDRDEDGDVVRRGAQAGDDAGDRSAHVGAVVDHVERQPSPRLPTTSTSVARLARGSAGRGRRTSRRRSAQAPSATRTSCSRRRRGGRRSALDAPWLGVDVHAAAANEAAQRDAAVRCELDRERRRRADRDEERAAGDGCLLHELEREPAADAEDERLRAAAGLRGTPSRRPCPSRCGGRRPRAGRAARPRRRRDRSRGCRRSRRTQAAPRAGGRGAPRAVAAATRRSLSTRGASTATASSAPLPQTPHELDV